ncbi:MAG: hypothetical protein ACREOA_01555 [Candidatus Dormibacteria bacterium]
MLHLEGGKRSRRAIDTCRASVQGLSRFLAAMGQFPDPAKVGRADVQRFLVHLLETRKPATAHNHCHPLRALLKWAGAAWSPTR